jgi:meso-butanediol dehydrogenase/(S,S)-butanediol dehydrogenase/diacetyl reductase
MEDWHRVMNIDVNGVFYGCRAAMPYLLESKGSIINLSSVSGLGGDWGMSFYNAAKGAVSNFTRSLALEYGGQGVRVNAVCPALTWSDLTADMKENKELMAKFEERIPTGRGAEPQEVADVIAFLASDDARFVNGVNLPVDGGLHASNGQPPVGM